MPWLLIKGPALSTGAAQAELRDYLDIDIVVDPMRLREALGALSSGGACVVDDDWDQMRQQGLGEIRLVMPSGMALDLHWGWFFDPAARRRFGVPVREALTRGVELTLPSGLRVVTADASDTLVHLCLHAALSGALRLSWLVDVDRALRRFTDPIDVLVVRAHDWRAAPVVALVIERARRLLATPVPAGLLRGLVGAAGVTALQSAERLAWFRPDAVLLQGLARSARPGAGAWLAAGLGHGLRSAARSRSGRWRRRPASTVGDLSGAVPGGPGFELFLQAVESEVNGCP